MVRRLTLLVTAALACAVLPAAASADGYRVRWGDNLTHIAARFGTSVPALARANRLDPTGTLVEGTVLAIPSAQPTATATASSYRVRPGDTLGALAARFGTTIGALAAANRLDPNGVLFAGIALRLPAGTAATPVATLAVPAAARYTVQLGDSLSAIAARYGTTVSALALANRLDPAKFLIAGTSIAVPVRSVVAASVAVRQPVSHGEIRTLVVSWAAHYGVSQQLALALAWMESGYQATVVSSAGAFGPMQVTPATRSFVEAVLVGAPIEQTTSGDVRAGVAYLHYLLDRFGGDERLALAGYFQGPAGVRNGLLPATKVYVANVLALKTRVS